MEIVKIKPKFNVGDEVLLKVQIKDSGFDPDFGTYDYKVTDGTFIPVWVSEESLKPVEKEEFIL